MILVTGGTGLLGTHLLLELIKRKLPVRVLLREESDPKKVLPVWKYYVQNPETLFEKIEWFRGDITNKFSLSEALHGADQVYHCAAIVSFERGKKREMYEVNVQGTRNVVDMCLLHNIKKLVYVSSIAAISKTTNDIIITESDGWPATLKAVYSQTKTFAELEVWRGIEEGLNAVIVNPSVILGPGEMHKSSMLFFDKVFKGLKYHTLGSTGFVDVRDVVKAMVQLMESDIRDERFILNAENMSYKDLFEKIAVALNVKPPLKYASPFMTSIVWKLDYLRFLITGKTPTLSQQSAKAAHTRQFYSANKIKKQLNFVSASIDETIEHIAGFYLREKSSF
jgi:nucleoside-diphosphate-sugar epimerase